MAFRFVNGESTPVFVCQNCTQGIKADCPFCVMPKVTIQEGSSKNCPSWSDVMVWQAMIILLMVFAAKCAFLAVLQREMFYLLLGSVASLFVGWLYIYSVECVTQNKFYVAVSLKRKILFIGLGLMWYVALFFLVRASYH